MHALKSDTMQKVIEDLRNTIEENYSILKKINELDFSKKSSDKWSKKEELGHLIDSALNNIQRFIRVQYEENAHIIYNQDKWANASNYQQRNSIALIELWYLLNQHIIAILENMDAQFYEKQMSTSLDVSNKNSILFIANDYIEHLNHHLKKLFLTQKNNEL